MCLIITSLPCNISVSGPVVPPLGEDMFMGQHELVTVLPRSLVIQWGFLSDLTVFLSLFSEHDLGEDDIYDCVPCEDDGDDIYEDIIKVEVRQPMKMGMTEDDKRNCCLVEIQETEAKYYKTLEDIEKNYMIPLKQVLSSQEMEAIFVNLEDIIRVHFDLLRAIDLNMVSGGSGLGKIFLDFKERLESCNPHRVFDPMLLSFVLRTQNNKIQLQHKDRRLCLSF
ncbi:hypothetical protein XENORESO_001762 [Xenotaenia resolanae]|uniref:DH domain-containing protein n=1 Tax=Xenotaenia resolanae TaxID=208358 RepID=A0ABV0W0E8_9TELE